MALVELHSILFIINSLLPYNRSQLLSPAECGDEVRIENTLETMLFQLRILSLGKIYE